MSLALQKFHGRRGYFQIVLEVMASLRQKDLSITHILQATYLNSNVLIPILEELERRGFVVHSSTTRGSRSYHMYHLTRQGFEVTEHYQMILNALQ